MSAIADAFEQENVDAQMWGLPTVLTRAERIECVRLYTLRGLSAREIAARLGVTTRTVIHDRRRTQETTKESAC